jgi:hypothetical protein
LIKGLRRGRKRRYSDDEIQEMRRLYGEGWTYDQLAARYGCGHGTVSYYCVAGHKEAKIERQLVRQKELPDKHREYRNRHRNKYSTYYQRRWRWSKKLKDRERWATINM